MYSICRDKECEEFKDCVIRFDENSYVVKKDDIIVGHFNLVPINDYISIEYEVLPKYRMQGIGTSMINFIEKYLTDILGYDRILLLIKYDNEGSLKIAKKSDYKVDCELSEEIALTGEMTNYIPYVKKLKL